MDLTNLIKEAISKEFRELEARISLYSTGELLVTGRRFLNDLDYPNAFIVFNELSKRDPKNRKISQVYTTFMKTKFHYLDKEIVDKIASNMIESIKLYEEKVISKEDLFALEKLVDKIHFEAMDQSLKGEFGKTYYPFKEYCMNVFLGEK